jgi:CO/xanthine dehydrogenase FAD-binding subunit
VRVRRSVDFPLLNLAVSAVLDPGGRVQALRMVASGLGSYPRRIGKIEEAARGRRLDEDVVEAVAAEAFRQCHPLDNLPVDPEWRRAMVPVLVRRAFEEISAA